MRIEDAVQKYQCPGCVCGSDTICYESKNRFDFSCEKHVAGTMVYPNIGSIYLGMPKGFDRIGPFDTRKGQLLYIFPTFDDTFPMDNLNIPVWKHKDKYKNTLIRGLQPRINVPFIFVILEDCVDKFDCFEVTKEFQNSID